LNPLFAVRIGEVRMSKSKEFVINDELLDKAIKICSTSTVGRVLKRFDVIENREELKKEVKELIYEEFRNLKVFIQAYNWGVEFKKPSNNTR
jgi:hypothetical protein